MKNNNLNVKSKGTFETNQRDKFDGGEFTGR